MAPVSVELAQSPPYGVAPQHCVAPVFLPGPGGRKECCTHQWHPGHEHLDIRPNNINITTGSRITGGMDVITGTSPSSMNVPTKD